MTHSRGALEGMAYMSFQSSCDQYSFLSGEFFEKLDFELVIRLRHHQSKEAYYLNHYSPNSITGSVAFSEREILNYSCLLMSASCRQGSHRQYESIVQNSLYH